MVDLKFFCGFSFAEIAAMRGVSERTVQRHWEKARIYLHGLIRADAAGADPGAIAVAMSWTLRPRADRPVCRLCRPVLDSRDEEQPLCPRLHDTDSWMTQRLRRDRWRAVSPHLDRALELTGDQRAAWLASLRAEDAALAADVEALLAEHQDLTREGFLEAPPPAPPAQASSRARRSAPTRCVSPIGQGGMGSVWLAERSDGRFQGQAAVKLLNASLVGHAGEARFRREGSILARLRHPHIAHLIDAGVSPAGQPYLVLEHVDGERIDRYCDERGLGVEARLRLFLDVLAAVAHAHANLIVHRDLKPSNVLVDDGRPGQAARLRHRQAAGAGGAGRGDRADARGRVAR